MENHPNLLHSGADYIFGALAQMGYHCRWGVVAATHAGAPHERRRLWVFAYANSGRCERRRCLWGGQHEAYRGGQEDTDADRQGLEIRKRGEGPGEACTAAAGSGQGTAESNMGGMGNGLANWSDRPGPWAVERGLPRLADGLKGRRQRIHAIGDGWCPQAAALAWQILTEGVLT